MSRLSRSAKWALVVAGFAFLPACMLTALPPMDWLGGLQQTLRDLASQASGSPTQPVKSSPAASPSISGATYSLDFDSTMTTLVDPGKEHVRAHVLLVPVGDSNNLAGEAPLEIVSADGDQRRGVLTEEPGTFRVVSVKLSLRADGSLDRVDLVYSLNPQVTTGDGRFGPSDWNLFWMIYDGHFTHTDDKLDDSGPEPLITVGHWDLQGTSARRIYHWKSTATMEDTTIELKPLTP